jgi:hypothetical protein
MNKFKAVGTITEVLKKKKGLKKDGSGEWVKQEFILDTKEQYNNIFCFELFGEDKVNNFDKYNEVGDVVEVTFNVNCNKWEHRFFTTLSAWKVFKYQSTSNSANEPRGIIAEMEGQDEPDDLPF